MHVAYIDEFGHNGLYIDRHHAKYKTHPVFGLGGFIIPADSIRDLSGFFRHLKERGLKEEIEAKVKSVGKRVEHWEKKGSSLLTTRNIESYKETRRPPLRLLSKLERVGAKVVYYGQEKSRGGPDTVHESNPDRYDHAMKQLIQRIHWDIPEDEKFMIILDRQGAKERLEVFAAAAAFMYSNKRVERLLEPPMEVESHLYQTVQCADWICALLGRIAAYKYDRSFSEFEWAPKYFGKHLRSITTPSSKIRHTSQGAGSLHPKHLSSLAVCYNLSIPIDSSNEIRRSMPGIG